MEKCKQGQKTLSRDFPHSHVFRNTLDVLPKSVLHNIAKADGITKVESILQDVDFCSVARCECHCTECPLPSEVDLGVFGAPCVDDSTIGSMKQHDGEARKVA